MQHQTHPAELSAGYNNHLNERSIRRCGVLSIIFIMEGQYREYKNTLAHKDITRIKSKCNNMETYSREQTIGKKKVKITLEFPYTVDTKEADRFEHMLKEIYLNKMQKGYLQISNFMYYINYLFFKQLAA